MATDAVGLGLAVRPRAAGHTWPIGRWLLIAAVLGWFGLLILVPSVAVLRHHEATGGPPSLRALAGDHRVGHAGQYRLRHRPGDRAGPAPVLGPGTPGRGGRPTLRRLAGGGRVDADRALWARGVAGQR